MKTFSTEEIRHILETEVDMTQEELQNSVIVFGGKVTGDLDVLNGYNFTQVEGVFENKLDIYPVPEKGAIDHCVVEADSTHPVRFIEYHDDCSVVVGGNRYYASRKV